MSQMAVVSSVFCFQFQNKRITPCFLESISQPEPKPLISSINTLDRTSFLPRRSSSFTKQQRIRSLAINESERDSNRETLQDEDLGVRVALSMLRFYKREISPILPSSCRYLPTCSEYSMQAYQKYGVTKGTILTAWRLCRCNPFGGSGFDPPRWFGEEKPRKE